jgi:hypothetical protein
MLTRRSLLQRVLSAAAGCVLARTCLVGPKVSAGAPEPGWMVEQLNDLMVASLEDLGSLRSLADHLIKSDYESRWRTILAQGAPA